MPEPLRRRVPVLAHLLAVVSTAVLVSCGGDGTGPDPQDRNGQTVSVSVSTSGVDTDPDGYVVTLGNRSAPVEPSGSVRFDDVAPGTYPVGLTGVAANCTTEGGASRSVTVTGSSGGQVSFSVSCDFADGLATVPCSGLVAPGTPVLPLDEVVVGRLPGTLEGVVRARVTWEGGPEVGAAGVLMDPDGTARVLAPLHPTGRLEGGPVVLRLTDGSRACPPLDLVLRDIPQAPGELSRVLDLVEAEIGRQAAFFGLSLAELGAVDPEASGPALLPLIAAWSVLDGPGHAGSLRALAAGGLDPAVLSRVEALLALTGLGDLLAQSPPSRGGSAGTPSAAIPVVDRCEPSSVGSDILRLEPCIEAAVEAGDRALAVERNFTGSGGWATAYAGLAATDGPATAALVSVVHWLAAASLWGAALALPVRVGDWSLAYEATIKEDDDGIYHWRNVEGSFANAGGRIPAVPVEGWYDALQLGNPILRAFLTALSFPVGRIADEQAEIIRTDLTQKVFGRDPAPLEIPLRRWGDFDFSDAPWTSAVRRMGSSVELAGRTGYRGVLTGVTTIEIYLDIAGYRLYFADFTVLVPEIQIELDPVLVWLEPGERQDFEVRVRDSVEPDAVALTDDPLLGTALVVTDPLRVIYQAPADDGLLGLSDRVRVRHTSRKGARANSTEERRGIAIAYFGRVRITPQTLCMEPGTTTTFSAVVEGPDTDVIEWSVDGGTIEPDGRFTAPAADAGIQSVTVTARVPDHPGLDDTATVQIGGCACRWSVVLDGQRIDSGPGDSATFQEYLPGTGFEGLALVILDRGGQQVVLTPRPEGGLTFGTGGPGVFAANVSGSIGTTVPPPLFGYQTRYPGPFVGSQPVWAEASLALADYLPGSSVRGAVDGKVALHLNQQDLDDAPRVPFQAEFQITVPGDYSEILRRQGTFTCTVPPGGG